MEGDNCKITDKESNCCSSKVQKDDIILKDHWNNTYLNGSSEKLGWYESDPSTTIDLILKTGLYKTDTILNVGAGNTTLVDELLKNGYSNLIATDISDISLKKLENRVGKDKVEFIVDDLTNPVNLINIPPVNLWVDRAVLHFFTERKDQEAYFELLKNKVKGNGFVLFAEYNLEGATRCAGLPIHRYSKEILSKELGSEFELIESFDFIYTMPSGDKRPYLYALYKRV